MKKTILLILSFLFLLLNSSGVYSQHASNGFYDNFYRGILDNGKQHDYSKFNGLNLNLWMHYLNWTDPPYNNDAGWTDWTAADTLNANLSVYGDIIKGIMINNGTNGYRTVANRVKIDRLCYGERSDYYCNQNHIDNTYYGFYAFAIFSGADCSCPEKVDT